MDYNIPDRDRCPASSSVGIEETILGLIGGAVALACFGVGFVVVIAVIMWAFKTVFGS